MVRQDEIEKIFGGRLENCSGEKPEWYCESSELSPEDQKWVQSNIFAEPQVPHERTSKKDIKVRSKVKGIKGGMVTDVSYGRKKPAFIDGVSYKLAGVLDDLENLPYYEKLIRERRRDFLRNCLVITLSADKRGAITSTKAAYFTGVVKGKDALQERIRRYKKKHTT